jgi:hypothetical protein
VEALQRGDGDKDDNSLLAVANFDLEMANQSQHAISDVSNLLQSVPAMGYESGRGRKWSAARPIPQLLNSAAKRAIMSFFLFFFIVVLSPSLYLARDTATTKSTSKPTRNARFRISVPHSISQV